MQRYTFTDDHKVFHLKGKSGNGGLKIYREANQDAASALTVMTIGILDDLPKHHTGIEVVINDKLNAIEFWRDDKRLHREYRNDNHFFGNDVLKLYFKYLLRITDVIKLKVFDEDKLTEYCQYKSMVGY